MGYYPDIPSQVYATLSYKTNSIVAPTKSDERLVGNSGAMLKVKALSLISIDDVELGIGDADQSTAPKVRLSSPIFDGSH